MQDDQARTERAKQRKLREKEKGRKLHRDRFVQAALQHKEGRDYIYWLLEICKIGVNPYTGNALNTAFQCGELNVGQQIQAHLIECSPEGFLSLLREREQERLNDNRQHDDPDNADNSDDTSGADSASAGQ